MQQVFAEGEAGRPQHNKLIIQSPIKLRPEQYVFFSNQLKKLNESVSQPTGRISELRKLEQTLIKAEKQLELRLIQQQNQIQKRRETNNNRQTCKNNNKGFQTSSSPPIQIIQSQQSRSTQKNQPSKIYMKDEQSINIKSSTDRQLPKYLKTSLSPHLNIISCQESFNLKKQEQKAQKPLKKYLEECSIERKVQPKIEPVLQQRSPPLKPKFATVNPNSINDRKPLNNFEQYKRSMDNSVNVKGYFDNKLSLRRSIDKRMHYDTILRNLDSIQSAQQPVKKPLLKTEKKMLNNLQKTGHITTKLKSPQGDSAFNYNQKTLASGGAGKFIISSMDETTSNQTYRTNKRFSQQANGLKQEYPKDSHVPFNQKPTKFRKSRNVAGDKGSANDQGRRYQNILPKMHKVEEVANTAPRTPCRIETEKVNMITAQGATHLPKIKESVTTVSQANINVQ